MSTRLCHCGRLATAGWSGGHMYAECLICRTARELCGIDLKRHRQPAERPLIVCWCCGRIGQHAGAQLITSCYQRERRAAMRRGES